MLRSLVGSEMCIRDRSKDLSDTDTYKVDVHKLKRGMYFIKINKGSDTTLLKFVKY